MAVYVTLNLVDCADKVAWEKVFENHKAVNGVAATVVVEPNLVAALNSAGEGTLSEQLRNVRSAERLVPDAVLQMNFR